MRMKKEMKRRRKEKKRKRRPGHALQIRKRQTFPGSLVNLKVGPRQLDLRQKPTMIRVEDFSVLGCSVEGWVAPIQPRPMKMMKLKWWVLLLVMMEKKKMMMRERM